MTPSIHFSNLNSLTLLTEPVKRNREQEPHSPSFPSPSKKLKASLAEEIIKQSDYTASFHFSGEIENIAPNFLESKNQSECMNLKDFLNKLKVSSKKTTLKKRLQLLKELKAFSHPPYQLVIQETPPLFLRASDNKGAFTLEVADQTETFFRICQTRENRTEESWDRPEENHPLALTLLIHALQEFWDLSENIVIFNLSKWKALLSPANPLDFSERACLLKQQMTFVHHVDVQEGPSSWWQAWLELQEPSEKFPQGINLQVIVSEDEYDSNLFAEESLPLNKEQRYLYVKMFEDQDELLQTPVYALRLSLDGSVAELVHIQAIPGKVSGTALMREWVHIPLENFFQPRLSLLCDEAKIEISPDRSLFLRQLRCGSSWYATMGYRPYDFENKLTPNGSVLSQSSAEFDRAVTKVQTMTVEYFNKVILKGFQKDRNKLRVLAECYLGVKSTKSFKLYTLHHLVSTIATTARQEPKRKVIRDLVYVYDNFLTSVPLGKGCSTEQKLYNAALKVIEETCVFYKAL